jgi:hypothetical protein
MPGAIRREPSAAIPRARHASLANDEAVSVELDPGEFVTRPQGRRAWVREGRRALDAQRERAARPIPKDRSDRLTRGAALSPVEYETRP